MEQVNGRTFQNNASTQAMFTLKFCALAHSVAQAIDHAHSHGVFHLNLHPGNVLEEFCITERRSQGFYVCDFGMPLLAVGGQCWGDMHSSQIERMLKFYPPNILARMKEVEIRKADRTVED